MWLCLNDAFLSIVSKLPAREGELLVRARRPGDIEKVFGRRTKVERSTDSDYLFRAVVPKDEVTRAIQNEVLRIDYDNFKDSVADTTLHDAYLRVWTAMAALQDPKPWSRPYTRLQQAADMQPEVKEVLDTMKTFNLKTEPAVVHKRKRHHK